MESCPECGGTLKDTDTECHRCGRPNNLDANSHAGDKQGQPVDSRATLACIVCNAGKYVSGLSAKNGVIVIRPRYAAFILRPAPESASMTSTDFVVLLVGSAAGLVFDSQNVGVSVESRVADLIRDDPNRFDERVEQLIENLGGVTWQYQDVEMEFRRANQIRIIASGARMQTVNPLTDGEYRIAQELNQHWGSEARRNEAAEFQPAKPVQDDSQGMHQSVGSHSNIDGSREVTRTVTPAAIPDDVVNWRIHTCAKCACRYGYRFKLIRPIEAATWEQARQHYDRLAEGFIETHPCPECGTVQPEMIGLRKSQLHDRMSGIAAVLVFILSILTVAAFLDGYDAIRVTCLKAANWLVLTIGCVVLFFQYRIASGTPNDDLTANHFVAQNELKEGAIVLVESSMRQHSDADSPEGKVTASQNRALIAIAAGILLMVAGELTRFTAGWQYTLDCTPPIVGTGDTAKLYFSETVPAINEMWRGHATSEVVNAAEYGLNPDSLRTSTRQSEWQDEIERKEDSSNTADVYAAVEIPSARNLVGSTLDLKLDADVEFPSPVGGNQWQLKRRNLHRTMQLHIGSERAGIVYAVVCLSGLISSCILFGFGCHRLSHIAKQLRNREPSAETVQGVNL